MNPVRSQHPPSPPPPPPPSWRPLPSSTTEVESGDPLTEADFPLLKKQKLNEEDDGDQDSMTFSDFEEEDPITTPRIFPGSKCDPLEGFLPEGVEEMDEALWDRYLQQIEESEGFDIKDEDYPGSCFMTTIWPMTNYLSNPKNVDMLKGYARSALKKFNDKNGTKHEVKDILKVNGGGCRTFDFYITLTVGTCDGDLMYFQVKAVRDIDMSLNFPTVRERAKGAVDIW